MREPQEIEDRGHEQVAWRVAAVDVTKAAGVVCTRVPREGEGPGRFVTKVWPVDATTNAILELADHLVAVQVEKVVLESTSDYWRPFYYLLEAAGLDVALVNARDVKNAPGRPKTDKLDAVWLAKLAGWGMLRPSFVPPAAGLHPAAHRPDPGADQALAAAGETAGRRADQGYDGGQPHRHHVGPRHARGADRRAA
jgi:transposase